MLRLDFATYNVLGPLFAILLVFGACNLSLAQTPAYSLTVEGSPASTLSNHTVYRFYVNMEAPEDELSAVFGNSQQNLILDAPAGVFNSGFNLNWSAAGINPAFLALAPDMVDDTYATIGLDGPASQSGLGGNVQDPLLTEDPSQPLSPFFLTDGASSLVANTLIGSAVFVTFPAPNARPQGADLRVLIMQVTTAGEISGQINYMLFPGGIQSNVQRFSAPFSGTGTFAPTLFVTLEGCMDESACNYDPDANLEPIGLCAYPQDLDPTWCDCGGSQVDALGVCGGSCEEDLNNNGICDDEEVQGCTYFNAVNYNALAIEDDGSCQFPDPIEPDGCTYPTALNYDEWAVFDDGSCEFPCVGEVNTNVFDWNGDYNVSIADFLMMLSVFGDTDTDFDGIWDSSDDCIDTAACNYDADPTEPCKFIDVLDICGGGCEADADNDGICDNVDDCIGVVDDCGVCNGPGPTNVVIEDIVITYDSVFLPLDQVWFTYAVSADTIFGYECDQTCQIGDSCFAYSLTVEASPAANPALGTTYRFYVNLENATDQVSAVFGNAATPLVLHAPEGVYNDAANSTWSAAGINPALFSAFPDLVADSYATIGLDGPASLSEISDAQDVQLAESPQNVPSFFQTEGSTSLLVNSNIGSAWFVTPPAGNASPQNGELRVLVMQITTTGSVSGQINYQLFPGGLQTNGAQFSAAFDGEGTYPGEELE